MRRWTTTTAVVAAIVVLTTACWNDLGALPDRPNTEATAINDGGVAAGSAWKEGDDFLAFRSQPGEPLQPLLPLPGAVRSQAVGVLSDGTVIGRSCGDPYNTCTSVSWDAAGTPTALPTLPPWFETVNSAGDAVGQDQSSSPGFPPTLTSQPWIWRHDTKSLTPLPSPSGLPALVTDISDTGFASGYTLGGGGSHAIRWNTHAGTYDDLGVGLGVGVNDQGVVVGSSANQTARWAPGQPVEAIDVGYTTAGPNAINDDGFIVGWASDGDTSRAWIWNPTNRVTTDLGGPNEGGARAVAINRHRESVGSAYVPDGPTHAARFPDPAP